MQVHLTAGYIEPGFHGQITLEIVVTRPILLPPGWPIAQIRFHETTGEIECYTERGATPTPRGRTDPNPAAATSTSRGTSERQDVPSLHVL